VWAVSLQVYIRVLSATTFSSWQYLLSSLRAAQRVAVQPPQAHRKTCQKANDLVRAAVGCNGVFGGFWHSY
jgi:hypothetical protein